MTTMVGKPDKVVETQYTTKNIHLDLLPTLRGGGGKIEKVRKTKSKRNATKQCCKKCYLMGGLKILPPLQEGSFCGLTSLLQQLWKLNMKTWPLSKNVWAKASSRAGHTQQPGQATIPIDQSLNINYQLTRQRFLMYIPKPLLKVGYNYFQTTINHLCVVYKKH